MTDKIYEYLMSTGGTSAVTVITVAVMLLAGFLMTRLTKLIKLPSVTAYIITGILIGPFCLNLIPKSIMGGTSFLPDIALAFIAFGTGEYFRLPELKKSGAKSLVITLFESLTASLAVFGVTYFVLKTDFALSLVLASLAAATAPASIMMIVRQSGAKGDFVNTLLQTIAFDDALGIVAFSVAVSAAVSSYGSGGVSVWSVFEPILMNVLVLGLGCIFGLFFKLLLGRRSTDNRLIIAVALIFGFCGICALLGVSPLLGCMSMATVYINITGDEKLFRQLGYFSPPILLLFFVRSGANFNLGALASTGTAGALPLAATGLIYAAVRAVAKYGGSFAGCAVTREPKSIRNFLGLALFPQAGVAIGLAALGARAIGGEAGSALETIVMTSSVLYELVGPACAKLSLHLSGAYPSKIEDIVPAAEYDSNGNPRSEADILAERIKKIRANHTPTEPTSEDEQAFLDAAEEQRAALRAWHFKRRR